MDEIVKYKNEINKVVLRKFNAKELDLFFAIVAKIRDKMEEEIIFTFDYLKELIKYETSNSTEIFYRELKSMYDKLIQCVWGWENEKEIVRFVLFTRYKLDKKLQKVEIKVNNEFMWVLNAITEGFTRFELEEFVNLKSSYTKEFYRRMKQFRNTGFWRINLEDFKRLLDMPENYRLCDIDKWVLKPIMKELGTKYNLKIEKKYGFSGGRGRSRVVGFEFKFLKESDIVTEENKKIQKFEKVQKNVEKSIIQEEESKIPNDLENYIILECENVNYAEEKYLKKVNYIEKEKFLFYCINNLKHRFNFLKNVKEKMIKDEIEKKQIQSEREEIILKIGKLELEKNIEDYLEKFGKSYLESKYLGRL